MKTYKKCIGILGGTFDPPHRGHINVAVNAVHTGIVDEVWMMVSPENPFKIDKKRSPAEVRLQLCHLIVDDLDVSDIVKVSDLELSLPTPSYMINTLDELRMRYQDYCFRLIIGADNIADFDKWRDSLRIRKEYGLIVYPRDYDIADDLTLGDNCVVLSQLPRVDVSATQIRNLASSSCAESVQEIARLTSPRVADFICSNQLYIDR